MSKKNHLTDLEKKQLLYIKEGTLGAIRFARSKMNKFSLDLCYEIILHDSTYLKHIINQHQGLCWLAIIDDPSSIKFIKRPSLEMCEYSVLHDENNLRHIPDKFKTKKLEAYSVSINGSMIAHTKRQTKELCLMALQNWPFSIGQIKNQTPEFCELAINQEPQSITQVKRQTANLCLLALEKNPQVYNLISICANPDYDSTMINLKKMVVKQKMGQSF
jgi:hypothetical protein